METYVVFMDKESEVQNWLTMFHSGETSLEEEVLDFDDEALKLFVESNQHTK